MRLVERFKKEGDFLFRWRSYLPLILVPFIVLVVISFDSALVVGEKYNNALIIFALVVGIAGQILRIFVAGFVPKDTSGRNTFGQQAASLNTSGIYSLCRNPLYLGNFFMMLSPVILVGNWIFALLFALGFWLYYERIIFAEEAFLSQKFGDDYKKWCDSTPCFFPRFSGFKRADLSFSLKTTLRREYHSLFGLASSLLATNLIIKIIAESTPIFAESTLDSAPKSLLGGGFEAMSFMQKIMPSYILLAFFEICLIIYVICRILVKKTNALSVENR